jgi:DNA mismatch endonuclease, patch repair protein
MSQLMRRNNPREMQLRRALYARGLRYRVHYPVPTNRRRSIDVAFIRPRVAVFLDGCFWHGCIEHGVQPRANTDWWTWKLERNQARDVNTNELLQANEWLSLRFWEHEAIEEVVPVICQAVAIRKAAARSRC